MTDAAAQPTAYEQRILGGIPVYVAKGAATDGTIPVYTWTADKVPIGFYNYAGTGFAFNIPVAADEQLRTWREAQVSRPRAELRLGRGNP